MQGIEYMRDRLNLTGTRKVVTKWHTKVKHFFVKLIDNIIPFK
jgi:hypothetical protein